MNVRDQIARLETLLSRIQSHARARRAALGTLTSLDLPAPNGAAPNGAAAPVSARAEPPISTIERVESAPPEALSDEDVLEMSSDVLESIPPPSVESRPPEVAPVSDAAFASGEPAEEQAEEEPPASSKRQRLAGTIDDAVAAAEREPVFIDEGREVPIKTPPPESGPQEAPPPPGALSAPPPPDDLREFIDEAEPSAGPTPEQLGATVTLDEPTDEPLELDAPRPLTPPPPPMTEELEVTLPLGKYASSYEIEMRRDSGELTMPKISAEQTAAALAGAGAATASSAAVPGEPSEVVERAAITGVGTATFAGVPKMPATPATFLQLLDDSIALGGS